MTRSLSVAISLVFIPGALAACSDTNSDAATGSQPTATAGGPTLDAAGGSPAMAGAGGGNESAQAGSGNAGSGGAGSGNAGSGNAGSGGAGGLGSTGGSAGAPVNAGGEAGEGQGGSPEVRQSAGCGKPAPTGELLRTTQIMGTEREYEVFVDEAYDPDDATRLIFFFHGNTANNDEARNQNMHDVAGSGAIMVYPIGLPYGSDDVPPDELGVGNRLTWSIVEESRDTAFFDAVVEELSADYCIDPKRIFSVGQSRGAFFSNLLACVRPDVVRAAAPVSGGVPPVLLRGDAPCAPKPMFLRNAANDNSGGNPQRFGDPAREFWLETNQCSMNTQPHAPEGAVEYQDCVEGSTLIIYADDGGHGFPRDIVPDIYDFFAGFE